ncbi:hypothetical protein NP233_g9725 [Leucocoprinus birnbaumii]|uniref:Uncharacterized protein n=1 Tax=Leucocoprinus birnbaumii TaxID=56174 RepID=A0AAD5VKA3_9AGAR|nr:hypothetical protein NP233_g9725 [Leucocoprinus birnbaumii]
MTRSNSIRMLSHVIKNAREGRWPILPALEEVILEKTYFTWKGEIFLKLVEERMASGASRLKLEILPCIEPHEWADVRAGLQRIVHRGFELEFIVDGEIMLW